MTRTTARRRAFGAVAAVVALFALSACGGAEDGDVASAGADPSQSAQAQRDEQAQALAFAQCMRNNGVEMPDPGPGQEGLMTALRDAMGNHGQTTQDENFDTAYTACKALLPEFASGDHGQADDETMLALAKCLREQGLDVPDDLYSGGALHDIPRDKLDAAMEKCREVAGFGDGH